MGYLDAATDAMLGAVTGGFCADVQIIRRGRTSRAPGTLKPVLAEGEAVTVRAVQTAEQAMALPDGKATSTEATFSFLISDLATAGIDVDTSYDIIRASGKDWEIRVRSLRVDGKVLDCFCARIGG
jgi:hypothetical protein